MLNYKFLGMDLYYFINCFFIYSFLGWVMECIVISIEEKEMVNRGFIRGPFCTIYGAGALSVYFMLRPIESNVFLLFISGMAFASLLEYVTAIIMTKLFGYFWWDYTNKPFNFRGILCAESSIAWGVLTIFLFRFLHPFVEFLISLYSIEVGRILISIVVIVYCIDFSFSFYKAYGNSKEESKEEMEQSAFK